MNKQEVFDTVATHLFRQGKPAMSIEVCQYRSEDGLKCAVGCLIPDDVYDRGMECLDSYTLIREFAGVLPKYFNLHKKLLSSLQEVHDNGYWHSTDNMRRALRKVAIRHHLKPDILDTLSFGDR